MTAEEILTRLHTAPEGRPALDLRLLRTQIGEDVLSATGSVLEWANGLIIRCRYGYHVVVTYDAAADVYQVARMMIRNGRKGRTANAIGFNPCVGPHQVRYFTWQAGLFRDPFVVAPTR